MLVVSLLREKENIEHYYIVAKNNTRDNPSHINYHTLRWGEEGEGRGEEGEGGIQDWILANRATDRQTDTQR